ncbi:hypothetical protein EAH73_20630 [Hymenobacter nivis]|uniref:RepB family plasmid replication initiator protein n=1 Tax=Hymenobacter nivis TaxID=1850093 RepID=A0A502GF76_9BACT|nr:MAG: hypothetical protein EOO60_01725 [Hymenobacter sp.]TPG60967.1 hypothetical protein EAH73_20630 [Hymenobacter nivis]
MTNIETIYLDSNICRYPHEVRQYGPYRGLAIDLIMWVAKETFIPSFRQNLALLLDTPSITFHASDFYTLFGHSRNSLLQPMTKGGQVIFALQPKFRADYGRTILDAVLFSMSAHSMLYDSKEYRVAGPKRETRYVLGSLKLFKGLTITRRDRSFVRYTMSVNPDFVQNNHFLSQLITLPDYASLRTAGTEQEPTGSSWTVGRFLYLRMRYAWGLWCSKDNKGKLKFIENFDELKEIAGFEKTPSKKAASLLRGFLARVCALNSIPFTAEVTKIGSTDHRQADGTIEDKYQVLLTKKPEIAKAEAEEQKRQKSQKNQLNFQQNLVAVAKQMER